MSEQTQELHCFENGAVDTVVASSVQDAIEVLKEYYGDSWEDEMADDVDQVSDERVITIRFEEESDVIEPASAGVVRRGSLTVVRAAAKDWAAKAGRGFLCSTEH